MIVEVNTKNPELKTKKIHMSDHAYQRMSERFGIKEKTQALGRVREWLREGHKVGLVTDENGKDAILYAFGRNAVYLSLDLSTVLTVKREEHVTYKPIKNRLYEMHRKEFNKLDRLEKRKIKRKNLEQLRVNAEISHLEYRKAKTRSENVRVYCDTRIAELKNYINKLKNEIRSIKAEKNQVANSMVSIL